MIFVPCVGGINHNEIEDAKPDDLTAGCNVLLNAVPDLGSASRRALPAVAPRVHEDAEAQATASVVEYTQLSESCVRRSIVVCMTSATICRAFTGPVTGLPSRWIVRSQRANWARTCPVSGSMSDGRPSSSAPTMNPHQPRRDRRSSRWSNQPTQLTAARVRFDDQAVKRSRRPASGCRIARGDKRQGIAAVSSSYPFFR
jgi:hypothetical protein